MSETDYVEKIRRGVLLYLREVHDIVATDAYIGDPEVHREWSGGCETCGWYENNITTDVFYCKEGSLDEWNNFTRGYVTIDRSEGDMLPLILPYIDRAN